LSKFLTSRRSTAAENTSKSDLPQTSDRNTLRETKLRTDSLFIQSERAQTSTAPVINFTQTHLLLRGCRKLVKEDNLRNWLDSPTFTGQKLNLTMRRASNLKTMPLTPQDVFLKTWTHNTK